MLPQELPLRTAVERFLTTKPLYPCLVLAHPEIPRLRQITESLISLYHWPTLSVGCHLSGQLLSVAPSWRSAESPRAFNQAVRHLAPGPVLCTDVDLLFEPVLALDALRVFRDASRIAPLVVLWPGTLTAGRLVYAQPTHEHYRFWKRTELSEDCIINI